MPGCARDGYCVGTTNSAIRRTHVAIVVRSCMWALSRSTCTAREIHRLRFGPVLDKSNPHNADGGARKGRGDVPGGDVCVWSAHINFSSITPRSLVCFSRLCISLVKLALTRPEFTCKLVLRRKDNPCPAAPTPWNRSLSRQIRANGEDIRKIPPSIERRLRLLRSP